MGKMRAKIDHPRWVQYPVTCTAEQENRLIRTLLVAATIATVSLSQTEAGAAIIELTTGAGSPHFYGTVSSSGSNTRNSLTLGKSPGRNDSAYYRAYLVFNLESINGQVTAAELVMRNGSVDSPDAAETVALYDFTATIFEIQTQFPLWRFGDLNTVTMYGLNADF
ncbi:hypothetical protein [Lacipirellula sp.]|uniref:hypothetical protein n=1 Tax=Lacipirellula sp. TaxID=2691419 RepID=UPI003D145A09